MPLWAIISGRSLYLFYPIGTMCFPGRVEVACWAGRSVVLFWPSLPFGGSPRGRFCTASSCLSSGSSNLLRRGHHFRWAGILADLCTGKLVFPMSFGVVPHLPLVWSCATDLPQSLPGGARGGLLLSVPGGGPCPCLILYIVPMVIDCFFAPLGPRTFNSATLGHYLWQISIISVFLSERC